MTDRPDVVVIVTDEERATPPYETDELRSWRDEVLTGRAWFAANGVTFDRHYTGSLACVPSRPTLFTGQYPDLHGVTQTDGLGKMADDSRMRWLRPGEVPTLGHWFRAAGYDTRYEGKWHISHADLVDPATGKPLFTNTRDGQVIADAVQQYLDADVLDPFGFSGWVGPEPHGAALANAGVVRDPIIADRVTAWLEDRYARRRAGDADAHKPFLLVAGFVNPHDIVLFPAWQRDNPVGPSPLDPPEVPEAPTQHESLESKPAAQVAYRNSYPSAYGPAPAIERIYNGRAQAYRNLYHRLHAEVDGPLDRVRRAVTDNARDTVVVRTSDHGDLLGSHGGLHQKWFTLYDEATRVPFQVARIGSRPTNAATIDATPTSHVDMVPTLLGLAGLDADELSTTLAPDFSELHPLPGRDLTPIVEAGLAEPDDHPVYIQTRDNVLEGDALVSRLARRMGRTESAPVPLRIQVPAYVGANFEGIVVRVPEREATGGAGHVWKLVRTFDDPATWTEPGKRHLSSSGPIGQTHRTEPVADQWELYDLGSDPIEAVNRCDDPDATDVLTHLQQRLEAERERCVPPRNDPWPYATRTPPPEKSVTRTPPRPVLALRRLAQRAGFHLDDPAPAHVDLTGHRALIVCTNHAVLDIGKPTGVFASEMTAPYYVFTDAGLEVDLASPEGGVIPVDPLSVKPLVRSGHDDRFLADDVLRDKVAHSLPITDVDITDYDIVFLAGGWGAAFDLGFSDALGDKITEANASEKLIGGVCHGPLGLLKATTPDGRPLVEARRISAVTDKQVRELGIDSTPQHPEAELRRLGADFRCETKFRDPLANHWEVDGNLVTGQNQNAGPMVARELLLLLDASARDST